METQMASTMTENFISDNNKDINKQSETENVCNNLNSSDDDEAPRIRSKKQVQRFSDSESGTEGKQTTRISKKLSESDSDSDILKSLPQKSRIQKFNNSSDSDASKSEGEEIPEQQLRMKNKRNKIKDKFKSLVTSRNKETAVGDRISDRSDVSGNSDDDANSIENIKKKIKERMSTFKSSVCDPDTSDEEQTQMKQVYKKKKQRKTIPTSPKPQRMSAKQAMDNMHKIKSESNRMLREKDVSLPYHRPKALSLKDIMSRRQPAVTSDGKSLPIKMNEDQLKEYAKMLEERQKKMMELFQSDDEDENGDGTDEIIGDKTDNNENEAKDTETQINNENTQKDNEISNETSNEISQTPLETDPKDLLNDSDRNFDDIIESNNKDLSNNEEADISNVVDSEDQEQDSESNIRLVYNDSSITEDKDPMADVSEIGNVKMDHSIDATDNIKTKQSDIELDKSGNEISENNDTENVFTETEKDSEEISLHSKTEVNNEEDSPTGKVEEVEASHKIDSEKVSVENSENQDEIKELNDDMDVDGFSDEDMDMEDIDNIIENAEIIKEIEDKVNSPLLIRDRPLNMNPKLVGAPGMVIDLDGNNSNMPRKSGVQLLKERFTFFAKLKTPEELERDNEKKIKPGTLHLKLKQDLEEKIAEQRSLEWAKRLEEEKQQHEEMKVMRGEEDSSEENDIDKIEAKLEEGEEINEESSESGEEELIEDDCDMTDKPRSNNALIDGEAEESECDENGEVGENGDAENGEDGEDEISDKEENDEIDEDSESEESESSESEEEQPKERKGRILKAFEDSDDEEEVKKTEDQITVNQEVSGSVENIIASQIGSQDDILQLAQRHKSGDDLFPTQISSQSKNKDNLESSGNDIDMGTQSFSIMESAKESGIDLNNSGSLEMEDDDVGKNDDFKAIAAVNLDNLTQNLPPLPIPTTQITQSQALGEDVLALCTGNFYDNEFVSQSQINQPEFTQDSFVGESQINDACGEDDEIVGEENGETDKQIDKSDTDINEDKVIDDDEISNTIELKSLVNTKEIVDDNLKSILDELNDPEFDSPKPNKFFANKDDKQTDIPVKKKFVIDSDDENNDAVSEQKKRKKVKKKKLEERALQISDDENDEFHEAGDEFGSDIEEDDPDRVVDYDSEENEIQILPEKSKKKRKVADFFEDEAELTSEDEWAGSDDEDEGGLDRMEREAGDDDTFHQGTLRRELGQIHMREVLDQDKREVRIIQELLFEDGDLGGGGRQRKFRWRNNDDIEGGIITSEFGDSQEDEFESEEQWRKQRHERELFLREMQKKDENTENLISISRTSIIKENITNISCKSTLEVIEINNENKTVEKKTAKDISPKKPFALLQRSYQGSLLSRGAGTLSRLAALATPLASGDVAKPGSIAPSSKRNFVFAALTPDEKGTKVTKRKADSNPSTPKLVKKMKTEDIKNAKNSLLEHLNV